MIEGVLRVCPQIDEIWLIGSRAADTATEESDWDFLAFADSARMDKLAQHTHLSLPNVDFLVVYDGDHFEEPWGDDPKKKSLSDFKWSKIADDKSVLYAKKICARSGPRPKRYGISGRLRLLGSERRSHRLIWFLVSSAMDPLREAQESEYAKIELQYSCQHEVRQLRLRTIKDGRPSYVRQCIRCGNTTQPVKKETPLAELKGEPAPAYDNDLEEHWRRKKSYEYHAVIAKFKELRVDDYGNYLSSPEWAQKRKKVLERAGGLCEGCRERPATEVHHRSYDHIGKEFLFELVAVCSACHDALHQTQT